MASGGIEIPVGLDFSGAFASIDSLGSRISGAADSISGKLGKAFNDVSAAARRNADEQKAALNALAATGQKGTAAWEAQLKLFKQSETELKRLDAAAADVEKELTKKPPQGIFDSIKSQFTDLQHHLTGGVDVGSIFSGGLGAGAAVAGLSALKSIASGVAHVFEDLFESGLKARQENEKLELSFKQAGLGGNILEEQMKSTTESSNKMALQFGLSASHIKEVSGTAAALGGVTGKMNETVTKAALAMEKLSDGSVNSEQAVRALTKGAGDPEAVASIGRLATKVPALATALQGIKDPAELANKALEVLGPTLKAMEEQAKGPEGSIANLKNAFEEVKKSVGAGLVDAAAPVFAVFTQIAHFFIETLVPAIESVRPVIQAMVAPFTELGNSIFEALAPIGSIVLKLLPIILLLTPGVAGLALSFGEVVAVVYVIIGALKPLTDYFSQLAEKVGFASNAGGSLWTTIKTKLGPIFSELIDICKTVGSIIGEIIVVNFKLMIDLGLAVYKAIANIVSGFFNFKSATTTAGSALEGFHRILDAVKGAFAAVAAGIKEVGNIISDVANAISKVNLNNIKDTIATIFSLISDGPKRVTAAASGAFNEAFDGGPIVRQFNEKAKAVTDALQTQIDELNKKTSETLQAGGQVDNKQIKSTAGRYVEAAQSALLSLRNSFGPNAKFLADTFKGVTDDAAKQLDNLTLGNAVGQHKDKVQTTFKDITSDLEGLTKDAATRLRNAAKLIAETQAQSTTDVFKAQLADINVASQQTLTDATSRVGRLIADLTKLKPEEKIKVNVSLDPQKPDFRVVTSGEARDLLSKGLEGLSEAVRKEAQANIDKTTKQFVETTAKSQVDALFAANNEIQQTEIATLQARESLITATGLDALKERGALRLQILRQQQSLELQQALQADEDFKEFALSVKAIAATTDLSPEEQQRLLDQFAARRLAETQGTTTKLGLLQQKQNQQTIAGEKQLGTDIQAELQKTDTLYQAAFSFRTEFAKAFFAATDSERKKALQKEVDDLKGEQSDAYKDYLSGKLSSYEDYASKVGEINAKLHDKEKELADSTLSFWKQVGAGISAVFKSIQGTQQTKLDEGVTKLNESLGKMIDSGQFSFEKISQSAQEVGQAASGVLVSIWGQMAASGRATLGDFADAALITTIKTIRSIVEGNIVAIITKAFAINPFLGVGAIVAIPIVEGLLAKWESDATARIGQRGFWMGGPVQGGEQSIRINERGQEFVSDHESTKTNWAALMWMNQNKGRPIEEYLLQRYGSMQPAGVATQKDLTDAITGLHEMMEEKHDALHGAVKQLAYKFETSHSVEVTGEITQDPRQMVATIKQVKLNRGHLN